MNQKTDVADKPMPCKREKELLHVEIIEKGFWAKAKPYAEAVIALTAVVGVFSAVAGVYFTFREYRLAAIKEDEAESALHHATNALQRAETALRVASDSKISAINALTVATNAEGKILGTVTLVNKAQMDLDNVSLGLKASIKKAEELDGAVVATKTVVSNLLFSVQNRKKEIFTVANTNRLIIVEKEDGGINVFFRLSTVPMAGSVDVEVPNCQDKPDACGIVVGNVYTATYIKDMYNTLKGSLITVKYYPSLDQSGGGKTITVSTNGEVYIDSLRLPVKYKRLAFP
jgi:hypothetical protein